MQGMIRIWLSCVGHVEQWSLSTGLFSSRRSVRWFYHTDWVGIHRAHYFTDLRDFLYLKTVNVHSYRQFFIPSISAVGIDGIGPYYYQKTCRKKLVRKLSILYGFRHIEVEPPFGLSTNILYPYNYTMLCLILLWRFPSLYPYNYIMLCLILLWQFPWMDS